MKPTTTNKYGYKVCSKERNKPYELKFKAHSYKQAVYAKNGYVRYPLGKRYSWYVFPISQKEARRGIWKHNPF